MSDVPETERERFEAWAETRVIPGTDERLYLLDRRDDGYEWAATQHAANGWFAAIEAAVREQPKPIDMVLYCPRCGMQHVDEPESPAAYTARLHESTWWELGGEKPARWTNEPHRTHLCGKCGHLWRPADVPTNGVAAIKTRGKNDGPLLNAAPAPSSSPPPSAPEQLCAEPGGRSSGASARPRSAGSPPPGGAAG